MASSPRALIIGGGIAGPVLALFLQRAGYRVQIFEAAGGPCESGGALGIAPNGMRVLEAAGVIGPVNDRSVRAGEWIFENQKGSRLAGIQAGDPSRYGNYGALITRPALHGVLVERAVEQGIPVHYGKRLVQIDDEPGRPVVAGFSDGSIAEGDFLVGADGIRSAVRQIVMPDAPKPVYTGMKAPGGFSPWLTPDVTAGCLQSTHFIFGQRAFFGYFQTMTPKGPRTAWWSTAAVDLQGEGTTRGNSQSELQARLLELHGDWAHPVPDLIRSAEEMIDIAIHDVPSLRTWSVARTVLIGDAAHAVAPHSGQGASMALEDSMLLAKLLREASGATAESVFPQFEAERRPRTDKVIALGRRNAQRKAVLSPVSYWIQQQMIRLFVPLTQGRKQDWLLSYKVE